MINFSIIIKQLQNKGYSESLAEAKLSQDILIYLLSKSRFNNHVTIKGGVVMSNISNDIRRSTIDFDLDLIKYPLTDESIEQLIESLQCVNGITINIYGKIEDLKHQDYKGKRVFVKISDSFNNILSTKIDIGVHTYLSITQDEYCFDVSILGEGICLSINSKEQMLVEKVKSLLKFGIFSTRFKDVYDIYFLIKLVDKNLLHHALNVFIFNDSSMKENTCLDIYNRLLNIFSNETYLKNLSTSNKNWVGFDNSIVLSDIISFFESL